MANRELFEKLKTLYLEPGTYAVFGSGPMGIRGLKECHDIDVIVTENLWNEFASRPDWEMLEMPSDGEKYLSRDDIELWKNWAPGTWNIEQLIAEAEVIDGLPFVQLRRVLDWKVINSREKDLKDAEVIQAYFKKNA